MKTALLITALALPLIITVWVALLAVDDPDDDDINDNNHDPY